LFLDFCDAPGVSFQGGCAVCSVLSQRGHNSVKITDLQQQTGHATQKFLPQWYVAHRLLFVKLVPAQLQPSLVFPPAPPFPSHALLDCRLQELLIPEPQQHCLMLHQQDAARQVGERQIWKPFTCDNGSGAFGGSVFQENVGDFCVSLDCLHSLKVKNR
jgi:hypothetical protein